MDNKERAALVSIYTKSLIDLAIAYQNINAEVSNECFEGAMRSVAGEIKALTQKTAAVSTTGNVVKVEQWPRP